MKVLVVDDSKVMRLIVMRTLRQAGFACEVKEAADGKQALEAIRKEPPDLVLSDWNMPEMSGIELLEALRAEGSPVKVGFVTTEGTAGAGFLAAPDRFFVSSLVDDQNAEVGGIFCDAEAAIRLGGGLLMLSRSEIDAQVAAQMPSDEAMLSMSEICNNLSAPLNEIPGNLHVRAQHAGAARGTRA